MKTSSWKNASVSPAGKSRPQKVRPLTVKQILKEAYQRHVRDRETLRAVKQCLG